MKKLAINQMENVEGGGINGCDAALGLAVGIWAAALGAASFGLASFAVGDSGGMAVGDVCHAN